MLGRHSIKAGGAGKTLRVRSAYESHTLAPVPPAPITLPGSIEMLRDESVKAQLRAIGERVRDIIRTGVSMSRAEGTFVSLLAAHAVAVKIFEAESAAYFKFVSGGEALKASLACAPGCTFCCHLYVEVTPLEVIALWNALRDDRLLKQRQAIASLAPQVSGLGPEPRRFARLPCPLLVDGQCGVYETRPFACRGLYSTSAVACEAVLNTPLGQILPQIRSPAVPRALAAVLGVGINAALGDTGLQNQTLELVSALNTLECDATGASRWLAGEQVFSPMPG